MTSRLLTLAWLMCLVAALWIAALTPQASGYELSIENAYPPLFWVLTISACILSAGLLLILAARGQRSPWWVSGLLGIVATNALILSLPLLRGYPVSDRADSMNHIGYARDIIATGRLSQLDFYPGQHLVQVLLELTGGITPGQALLVTNLLMVPLLPVWSAFIARRLADNVRASYLGAAFSSPLVFLAYMKDPVPSMLSAMLIPPILALRLSRTGKIASDRAAVAVAEILLLLLLVYFHPVTTVDLIVALLALAGAARLYSWLTGRRHERPTPIGFVPLRGIVAITCTAFVLWYSAFNPVINGALEVLHYVLGQRNRQSALGEAVGQVQIAHLPLLDLARILLNQFGVSVLIVALTLLGACVLIYRSMRRRQLPPGMHFSFIGGLIIAILLMMLTFTVSSAERYPIRLMRVLIILGVCALPWWSWEGVYIRSRRGRFAHWPTLDHQWRTAALYLIGILVFGMIVVGQLNVYAAPHNGLPNEQVTNSELSGMRWLIDNRTGQFVQASILPDYVPRFQSYFEGYAGQRVPGSLWWQSDVWLPSHFYQPGWHCVADIAPGETSYLAISESGRIAPLRFPESVRALAHLYTEDDLQSLAHDRSVSELYDNGGFQVWMTDKYATCP